MPMSSLMYPEASSTDRPPMSSLTAFLLDTLSKRLGPRR